MIKEKKYLNDPEIHISIDPCDEGTVIVSSAGHTRIWVKGKEINNAVSVTFSHKEDGDITVDVKMIP